MSFAKPAGRFASYAVVAAASALLVATVSQDRFASFRSVWAVAVLALVIGAINAGIVPLFLRLRRPPGCAAFVATAVILNGVAFAMLSALGFQMRLTPWGIAFAALVTTVGAGVVYTLVDEPLGGD